MSCTPKPVARRVIFTFCPLHFHPAGQHIIPLTAADGADADHRAFAGIHISGNQGLQGRNDLGSHHNGIYAHVWSCRMAGGSLHRNVKPVRSSRSHPSPAGNGAGFRQSVNVLAHNRIHPGILQNPVGDHSFGAAVGGIFLRGLKNQLHTSPEGVFQLRQHHGRAQQHGGMGIVAAGVHNTGILRLVGQVRLFR